MSPRKQPTSLYILCIKISLSLINDSCYRIEKCYFETGFDEFKKRILVLKEFLMRTLHVRLFEDLCLRREYCQYSGDPVIQLHVLIHPMMSIFRKYNMDNDLSREFWIKTIPSFTQLVVLDLRFICTDEILIVIATKCLLLEELNIVSKLYVCNSQINASMLTKHVSDVGLCFISSLKHLRILTMDPPRHIETTKQVCRCVTKSGIKRLLQELPSLIELNILFCDIGSIIISGNTDIGPLSLEKANSLYASAEDIRKLFKICPNLKDFSIIHLSTDNKETIIEEITASDLRLTKLNLSFFSYTQSLQRLLEVHGKYLTHFTFWEINQNVSIDSIVVIGTSCPNLTYLDLITQSNNLFIPRFYKRPEKIFTKLRSLTLGNKGFNLDEILLFFLDCTEKLQELTLNYQTTLVFGDILLTIVQKGYLKNMTHLSLDSNIEISKDIVKQIIQMCDNLTNLSVDIKEDAADVIEYINKNNLDLKLETC